MAVYKIVTVPNEVLRTKAKEVVNINAGVLKLLDNMRDTMYEFDGVGLAAPQIGVLKRVVVIDPGDNYMEFINPEIIYREGEQVGREGCLSVPGVWGKVARAQKIKVRALNRNGELFEIEAEGLLARALQHEIDHLDGILFIDKATDIEKEK